MPIEEMIAFANVYSAALGTNNRKGISDRDIDLTAEVLKCFADQKTDWAEIQKETYKAMVEWVKLWR